MKIKDLRKARLQRWEAANIDKAQRMAQDLCGANPKLPSLLSLTALYKASKEEMIGSLAALAKQDELARKVLGILEPAPVAPEIETVEGCPPVYRPHNVESILETGGKKQVIMIEGLTLNVDLVSHDGRPSRYVAGVIFHLSRTPALTDLIGRAVLVGLKAERGASTERLEKLQERLVGTQLIFELAKRNQIAIVHLQEMPLQVGDVETILDRVQAEAPRMIEEVLIALEKGVTEIDPDIGKVNI